MRSLAGRCLIAAVVLSFSPAALSAATRIEQNDPSISYSGNWFTNENAWHSNGVSALTNSPGATATVTFTGTGITWIGVSDQWSGLATVYVDGKMQVIDTYSDPAHYQAPLFAVRGLVSGPHRMTIEVTHERDSHTAGSWVWIDAFDIEDGSGQPGGVKAQAGRVEQDNPALAYTGKWFPNSSGDNSGGSAVLATDAGSRVSISFVGTGISWIAYRDEWSGIARVYLDGDLKTTVDTYLTPSQAQRVPYSIGGLASSLHTLTIEVTGTHNESSKGSWIWIDAFDIVDNK